MILVDLASEGRLLAAMLVEPAVLRAAGDVELDDFTDLRFRAALAAIRHLQSRWMLVDLFEVDAQLHRVDEDRDSNVAEQAGLAFLAMLLCSTPPYNHAVLWEHDMCWLRELANRRREATCTQVAA